MSNPKRKPDEAQVTTETVDTLSDPAPKSAPDPAKAEPAAQDTPEPEESDEPDMSDPKIRMAAARAAKKARQDALQEAEAKAKQEAERAAMDELTRTKAELAEARDRAAKAEQATTAAKREAEFSDAVLAAGYQLAGGQAPAFLRAAVADLLAADDTLDTPTAVARAVKANPFLVKQPGAATEQPRGASTATGPKVPAAPAAKQPGPPVDVMKMTPEEYREYRQQTHGV